MWKRKWNGSLTVEASMVVPVILTGIFLILFVNLVLHDVIVTNSTAIELLYAEDDVKTILEEELSRRTMILSNTKMKVQKTPLNKTVSWSQSIDAGKSSLLSGWIRKSSLQYKGKYQKKSWSFPQIIWYLKEG